MCFLAVRSATKIFVGISKMTPTSCSSQSGASAKCEKVHGIVMEISGVNLENLLCRIVSFDILRSQVGGLCGAIAGKLDPKWSFIARGGTDWNNQGN